jgi:hypothetical protein
MGWEDFNLNLMESADFSITAQNVILRVFDSACGALDDDWKRESERYEKAITAAYQVDEAEGGYMSSERDWEEDLYRQRQQGVGALALDWLMCSFQGALHSAKNYLRSTHPPKAIYKGRNWLERVSTEYQQRFDIDFGNAPVSFERIQELVLARNAGIHRDKGSFAAYLKIIKKPAFVDEEDRFFVTKEALVAIIRDCEEFLRWVVAGLEKLGPARQK